MHTSLVHLGENLLQFRLLEPGEAHEVSGVVTQPIAVSNICTGASLIPPLRL